MSRLSKFFRLAKKEAEKSCNDDYRHGGILTKGGKVLNVGHNEIVHCRLAERHKTHGGMATRHAEINCILGIDRKITTGSTVFVVRISRSGKFRNSKPCDMCVSILKFVGVKRIIYSIGDDEYGVIRLQS